MNIHSFNLHATNSYLGFIAVLFFVLAYLLVILEEVTDLRKSKPVLLASGIIWAIVAIIAKQQNLSEFVSIIIKKNILEYAELLLFLIVAMTYINTLEDRQVFNALRIWLVNKRFSLKQLFWTTGILAFFISPIADNLTTALVMSAIVIAVAPNNKKFICCASINIVVAANAGGAFSPFGDITTLMVWQNNKLAFLDFFRLFVPAVVSFIIPAVCMSFAIENKLPNTTHEKIHLKFGARRIILLFLLTITLVVIANYFLNLPPVIGMMAGFGLLKFFGFYIKKHETNLAKKIIKNKDQSLVTNLIPFDIFKQMQNIEWDTLLFFYGVMMCIGGLDAIGYLENASSLIYNSLGNNLSIMHQQTPANIIIGVLSSIIDNIPLMFAVLTMDPSMSQGQWLLVTLTLGIGGSLLSIGSAAGVALMGQTKGNYSFFAHLKWSWAILLGYIAAIYVHFLVNGRLFV